jgi:hypothetical protein
MSSATNTRYAGEPALLSYVERPTIYSHTVHVTASLFWTVLRRHAISDILYSERALHT